MLVLASRSPRRSDLLRAAGFAFIIRAADVDESVRGQESPIAYVQRLAEKKAVAVEINDGEIIIAADTTVAIGEEILGKPLDRDDAKVMLQKLSGRRHDVYTGVCLRSSTLMLTRFSCTSVWFNEMTSAEIENYVRSGEPFDKAGAYAIQGVAANYIPRIDGSYTNVVGLPVDLVYRMLNEMRPLF